MNTLDFGKYLIHIIVKYRIYVSAFFFLFAYKVFTKAAPNADFLPILISFGCWHYSLYIFNKVFDLKEDRISQPEDALNDNEKNKVLIFSLLLLFAPLPILYFSHHPLLPYIVFMPVGLLYSIPLTKNGLRIKNILLVKNIYSALFCWSAPVIAMIYFYSETNLTIVQLSVGFIPFGITLLIFELLWDIRDMEGDRASNNITVPVRFGIKKTKLFCFLLLIFQLLFALLFKKNILLLFIIYSAVCVFIVNNKSPNWLYHLITAGISLMLILI